MEEEENKQLDITSSIEEHVAVEPLDGSCEGRGENEKQTKQK